MKTTNQLKEIVEAYQLRGALRPFSVVFVSSNENMNVYARRLFCHLFDHVKVTKESVTFYHLTVHFASIDRFPSDFFGRCDRIVIDHHVHEVGGRLYPAWVASMDIIDGRNAK